MSGRAGEQGRGGGRGRGRDGRGGGRGGRGSNRNRIKKKTYTSNTPAIKDDIFDCGKPEHAGMFDKSMKRVINHHRMSGDNESGTVASIMENMQLVTIPRPPRPVRVAPDPPNDENGNALPLVDDEAGMVIWHGELKLIPARERDLKEGLTKMYATIWDQCSITMKSKLEQLEVYHQINQDKDPVALAEEIRNIMCGREAHKHPTYTMVQMIKMLCLYVQKGDESNEDYKECFDALWNALEQQGGCLTHQPGLINARAIEIAEADGRNAANINEADRATARIEVGEQIKASFMLSGANNGRHQYLKNHLENKYAIKQEDGYPDNTVELVQLMNNFRVDTTNNRNNNNVLRRTIPQDEDGINFAQEGEESAERDATTGLGFLQSQEGPEAHEPEVRHTYQYQKQEGTRGRKKSKKKKDSNETDPAKLQAAKEKQEAPEVATTTCLHCGGNHHLAECPDLTEEQLGQVLVQLNIAMAARDDPDLEVEVPDGGTLIQKKITWADKVKSKDGIKTTTANRIKSAGLKKTYLYLDTCTTDDQCVNGDYLSDIHEAAKSLTMHTNAGSSSTKMKGYLGSHLFWYDRMGIANVISLRSLERKYHVRYDSKVKGGAFIASTPEGDIVFARCPETGFPYLDLDDQDNDGAIMLVQTVRQNFEGYTRQEVERAIEARNLQNNTGHPSETAYKAEVSRRPVESRLFADSHIEPSDISNARKIFGPSLPCRKGKWVRGKSTRVSSEYVSIPANLINANKYVTLVADVMFVSGLPFFITMSRKIRFITVQYVPRRTASELSNALKQTLSVYKRAGFICQLGLMDGEFDKVKERMSNLLEINTTAKNEHVSEIERKIRHTKDTCRSIKAAMPFKVLPNAVVKALVINAVMWMNAWTQKNGVSEIFSPREIVLRWQLSAKIHARAKFGSYCLAYDEPDITNNQDLRGRDTICLGPTGNRQGTHKFFCLESKRVIKRKQFDEYPMPDSILKRVEAIGVKDKNDAKLRFRNRKNERFDWDMEDEDEEELIEDNAVDAEVAPFPDIPAEMPGVGLEEHLTTPLVNAGPEPGQDFEARAAAATRNANFGPREAEILGRDLPAEPAQEAGRDEMVFNLNIVPAAAGEVVESEDPESEVEYEDEANSYGPDSDEEDEDYDPDEDEEEEDDAHELPNLMSSDHEDYSSDEESSDDESEQQAPEPVTRSGRVSRQPARLNLFNARSGTEECGEHSALKRKLRSAQDEPSSSDECSDTEPETDSDSEYGDDVETMSGDDEHIILEDDEAPVFGAIMLQLSLKQGLREWGDRAEKSATKEMKQLHDMSSFFPRDAKTLTREERIKALRTLIFLKEKKSGVVKSRTCIDGSPQREWIPKEDAAAPTASTDALFITGAIDAFECRDVAFADMPGAFLTSKTDEKVIVKLTGELCELMVKVDPKIYRKYVTTERSGRPILYVELYKSVYGLLRSALLFYRKFKRELTDYGFIMNPYDPCTGNMTTASGDQMTVLWHVDDVKISCVDSFEITKLLSYLNKIYSGKIVAQRGRKGEYLGMNLDFTEPGVFQVDMIDYIKNVITDFPEEITGSSPTPHADHLFKIRDEEDAKYLPEEQAQQFHKTTAQLLFLQCRARRDIQVAVAFLTTRVKHPDEDDWGKLKRVLKYLKGTLYLKLRITVDSLTSSQWSIDASHGVHWDCKGQTGAGMTLGRGAVVSFSRKQKINTRSSTESELVGVDDALPTVLWSLYFIQEQGYDMSHATIYQDNKSAILLERNGKMSSRKGSKYIKMKYFFATDCIQAGDIKVEHMPTKKMWIDVNTNLPNKGDLTGWIGAR